jgi:hypothetical protein
MIEGEAAGRKISMSTPMQSLVLGSKMQTQNSLLWGGLTSPCLGHGKRKRSPTCYSTVDHKRQRNIVSSTKIIDLNAVVAQFQSRG